jgi:3-isopropylmalate dehydrogenase
VPHYRIAVVAGDGIGPEVIEEALKVLHAVTVPGRLELAFEEVEAGAACYRRTGEELPRETLEVCLAADAILFGAAGLPDVRFPDGTEIAPQLTLRIALDLYVGLRPIRLHPGVPTPLRLSAGERIDYVILRENTEGLYASRGGGVLVGGSAARRSSWRAGAAEPRATGSAG